MSYVYVQSETAAQTGSYPLYTVGFYDPAGKWQPESDHGGRSGKDDAAARVAWLNGYNPSLDQALNEGDGAYRP